mmetsp:Transcript_17513/g.37752  ORF Transcript_17513/g.37752 Transcript_17513/m.37752 type:complete len:211 (+) Transcript_17513:953-1585(+)
MAGLHSIWQASIALRIQVTVPSPPQTRILTLLLVLNWPSVASGSASRLRSLTLVCGSRSRSLLSSRRPRPPPLREFTKATTLGPPFWEISVYFWANPSSSAVFDESNTKLLDTMSVFVDCSRLAAVCCSRESPITDLVARSSSHPSAIPRPRPVPTPAKDWGCAGIDKRMLLDAASSRSGRASIPPLPGDEDSMLNDSWERFMAAPENTK